MKEFQWLNELIFKDYAWKQYIVTIIMVVRQTKYLYSDNEFVTSVLINFLFFFVCSDNDAKIELESVLSFESNRIETFDWFIGNENRHQF